MLVGKRTKIFAALTAAVKPASAILNYYVGRFLGVHDIIPGMMQNALLGALGAAAIWFLADKVDRNGNGKNGNGQINGGGVK